MTTPNFICMSISPTPPSFTTMNSHLDKNPAMTSKQRKIRKGTHSCWECKRRKVRCVFAQPSDALCITCRRRGKLCICQELSDKRNPEEERVIHTERAEAVLDQPSDRVSHTPIDDHVRSWAARDTSSDSTPTIAKHQYHSISQALRQAFPIKNDIVILLNRVSRVSTIIYKSNLRSRSALREQNLTNEARLTDLMNPETHPVLLARQMLYFASALLYLPSNEEIHGLTEHHRVIMERLAKTAIDLVTTNNVLLGTMESLECILLEGFYHIDGGNMRRAWIVLRRAVMAAQITGLHRLDYHLKVIDSENGLDPQYVWLNIVMMERFLSLLLGLPSSTSTLSYTPCPSTGGSISEDELPHLHSQILGRILRRNECGMSQQAADMTREIDQQLVKIAESLPPKFWRALSFSGLKIDSEEAFLESSCAWQPMCHYVLITQLHLPYVLCLDNGNRNEYSRVACTNASREILTRSIAFRTFNPLIAAGRMGDFLALVAGMTLTLVHIVSHSYRQTDNILVHQRLADRGIVEQALECMESVSKLNEDVLTMRCATLLKNLLLVEGEAVRRQNYGGYGPQQPIEDHEGRQNVILITVPYFGTVEISCDGVKTLRNSTQEDSLHESITMGGFGIVCVGSERPHNVLSEPTAGFNVDSTSISTPVQPFDTTSETPATAQIPPIPSGETFAQECDLYPEVAADIDDWVFQGIDTAFFTNFLAGSDDQLRYTPNSGE